jgi:hypothetical protein
VRVYRWRKADFARLCEDFIRAYGTRKSFSAYPALKRRAIIIRPSGTRFIESPTRFIEAATQLIESCCGSRASGPNGNAQGAAATLVASLHPMLVLG